MVYSKLDFRATCATLTLSLVLASLVCGCSAETKPEPQSQSKVGRGEEYVTGIAAAFYCACGRWPDSWRELQEFDDALHVMSERSGKPALTRFEWTQYKNVKLGRSTDGYLTIDLGPGDQQADGIAVPMPDCSRFDRTEISPACAAVKPGRAPAPPRR